mgnify:CR=1 FL=1
MLNALIVDDEAPARSELRFLLEETGRINSISEASNAREAVEKLVRSKEGTDERTDVLFMDISMPKTSGMQLADAMRKLKSGYRDVVFVLCDEDPGFASDTQHRMYGVCKGEMEVDGKEYPYFELLFWDD